MLHPRLNRVGSCRHVEVEVREYAIVRLDFGRRHIHVDGTRRIGPPLENDLIEEVFARPDGIEDAKRVEIGYERPLQTGGGPTAAVNDTGLIECVRGCYVADIPDDFKVAYIECRIGVVERPQKVLIEPVRVGRVLDTNPRARGLHVGWCPCERIGDGNRRTVAGVTDGGCIDLDPTGRRAVGIQRIIQVGLTRPTQGQPTDAPRLKSEDVVLASVRTGDRIVGHNKE